MINISIEDDQRMRKSHGAYLCHDSCERARNARRALARVCVSQEIRARRVRLISRSQREDLERSGVSFGTSAYRAKKLGKLGARKQGAGSWISREKNRIIADNNRIIIIVDVTSLYHYRRHRYESWCACIKKSV